MLISKKPLNDSNFSVLINQNSIEKSECVKYLGVYLDNKLSWRTHIDKICKQVSKVCEMIYKLRYYVPLSTLKIVYFSLFHSHIQYSLINWGRASKSILYKLKILQNKILRAMLFYSEQDRTNLLYFKLKILKLENMISAMNIFNFVFPLNREEKLYVVSVCKCGRMSGRNFATVHVAHTSQMSGLGRSVWQQDEFG